MSFTTANSPACSVHTLDAEKLSSNRVRLFAIIEDEQAIAMGALKELSGPNGELKSMHVHADFRGKGLADQILASVFRVASDAGIKNLFLETGSQDAFEPARQFYQKHGFEYCAPFEGYVEDSASVFMMRKVE